MLDAISYGRHVALIFAFHCNHCHAAPPGTASGGLNTATYQGLMAGGGMGRAIVAGDPHKSLLMEFLDGRRARRMPLDGPGLTSTQIATIARWITEGAKEDATPVYALTTSLSPKPGRAFTVVCRVPIRAYLRLIISGKSGEILHREETALASPGEARWPLTAGARWPRQATARVEIAFPESAPTGAQLRIE